MSILQAFQYWICLRTCLDIESKKKIKKKIISSFQNEILRKIILKGF